MKSSWRRQTLPATLGLSLVLCIVLMALFAPLLTAHDPNKMHLPERYAAPSRSHLFGQDENGADVFAKVIYGARISLTVSFTVVFISTLLGLFLGSLAGFYGSWMDMLIMRFIDLIYAFPGFLLALALVAMLGPSVRNLILAMCLTTWTSFARLVRGEILHLKERDYVLSARAMGASHARMLILHIWPNLVGLLIVQATLAMSATIIAESGLSFLGLGAPLTTPTWGALLSSGRKILFEAPHVSFFPGLFILTLVLGFNLFGEGLRDAFDPKRKT